MCIYSPNTHTQTLPTSVRNGLTNGQSLSHGGPGLESRAAIQTVSPTGFRTEAPTISSTESRQASLTEPWKKSLPVQETETPTERKGMTPMQGGRRGWWLNMEVGGCVCVRARASLRACVRVIACVCLYLHARVHVCVCVLRWASSCVRAHTRAHTRVCVRADLYACVVFKCVLIAFKHTHVQARTHTRTHNMSQSSPSCPPPPFEPIPPLKMICCPSWGIYVLAPLGGGQWGVREKA